MGQPFTPSRLEALLDKTFALLSSIEATDVVPEAPPVDPEDPTPAEIQNVSDMLDQANGRLSIIAAAVMDTATTPQEKVALIQQTLGEAP
jgi:hypothetical protein